MTSKDVAALACRVLSVYAFLNALGTRQWLGLSLMPLESPAVQNAQNQAMLIGRVLSSSLFPAVLFTVAGVFLWIRADWLAGRMVSGVTTPERGGAVGVGALQTTAVAIVGLVVLAQAIPHACDALGSLWLQARTVAAINAPMPDLAGRVIVQWVTLAIQVILGLWLLLGANGISGFLGARGRVSELTR